MFPGGNARDFLNNSKTMELRSARSVPKETAGWLIVRLGVNGFQCISERSREVRTLYFPSIPSASVLGGAYSTSELP